MSNRILVPPFAKFSGSKCRELRIRYQVNKVRLCQRAGAPLNGFERWEKGWQPFTWKWRGAIYDALLTEAIPKAERHVQILREALKVHRNE